MANIEPAESVLIQAHALIECILNLAEFERNRDPVFTRNMNCIYGQTAKRVADQKCPVFGGQGALFSMLYLLLVLPQEWQKNDVGDLRKYNLSEAECIAQELCKVTLHKAGDKFTTLDHLRNALSHGRLLVSGEKWVIEDGPFKDGSFSLNYRAEFSNSDLGKILECLNKAFHDYIVSVISKR